MKKVLVTLAMASVAASVLAQGTLGFNAGTSNIRYSSGTAIPTGNAQVQFGWAPVGASYTAWMPSMTAAEWAAANPAWTIIGAPINVGVPAAGKFTGGTLTITGLTPPGAIVQGVIIGWTGQGAASWLAGYDLAAAQAETATTHQFGVSAAFTVDTGDPTTTPAGTAGSITAVGGFTGLTLANIAPIPEPSSFALAGLGAAALLIFRRRK